VPCTGLFAEDSTGAISPRFKWPDYSAWWRDEAYALGIRSAVQPIPTRRKRQT
jgi:hypothetical protein